MGKVRQNVMGFVMGLAMVAVVACSAEKTAPKNEPPGQSFEAAMQLVCNVDEYIEAASDADPLDLDQRRSDYLQQHVKNPDVIYHQTLWRVQSSSERSKTIRDLSKQAKLQQCPYADALASDEL